VLPSVLDDEFQRAQKGAEDPMQVGGGLIP